MLLTLEFCKYKVFCVWLKGSEDPERHALYIWENLIEKDVKAKRIAIVAHSFGGVVTQDLV